MAPVIVSAMDIIIIRPETVPINSAIPINPSLNLTDTFAPSCHKPQY